MRKFIIGGFVVVFLIMVTVLVALFTSVKIKKDEDGMADISILWGLIKVNERTKKVSVFGDFINVDGINEKVKVGKIVEVDGKENMVAINKTDIIVSGKDGIVKVKKAIVVDIKDNSVFLDPNYQAQLLKSAFNISLNLENKFLEIKGQVVGEDEFYLHIETAKLTK